MITPASKLLLAAVLLTSFATIPTGSKAQSSGTGKSDSTSATSKTQASDDFEENRRLHVQKSKENNQKKATE